MDFDSAQSSQPTNIQPNTDQPQPLPPATFPVTPPPFSPPPVPIQPVPQVPLTPVTPTPPAPMPQTPPPQPFSPETFSSTPPITPEPTVTSITPEMPTTPPSPQNFQISPTKKFPVLLIILLVLIFSVGLGYGAYYFLEQPKDILFLKSSTPTPTVKLIPTASQVIPTVVSEIPTVAPVASGSAVPVGYVIKDTLCYSITVPTSNNTGSENSCDLSYSASISTPKNNSLLVGAGINSELKEYSSSQNMAEKWLVDYQKNNPTNTQITKGLTKVGGVDSYFFLIKDSISKLETQYTFVYTPGKYTIRNLSVTGFSIIQTFSDPDNADVAKQEMEKLFYTWQWK